MFTVGMAAYDDYDGVFFTVQALRLYHPLVTEIIIIDNNPGSTHGRECERLSQISDMIKYIPFSEKISSSVKGEVFKHSTNEYVVVCDCHVLFTDQSFEALREFYLNDHIPYDLVQGPLLYDNLSSESTHLKEGWGTQFFGIWDTMEIKNTFTEIPAQGMGAFSCKKGEWLGFNESFRGFGGEEYYIHEKYKQKGGRCICVKDFKWMHRFNRPNGIPFPNTLEDRLHNYIVGRKELNLPYDDVIEEFKEVLDVKVINDVVEQIAYT